MDHLISCSINSYQSLLNNNKKEKQNNRLFLFRIKVSESKNPIHRQQANQQNYTDSPKSIKQERSLLKSTQENNKTESEHLSKAQI